MANVARPHIHLVAFYDFQIIPSLKNMTFHMNPHWLVRLLLPLQMLMPRIKLPLLSQSRHTSIPQRQEAPLVLIQYLGHRLDHIIISIEFSENNRILYSICEMTMHQLPKLVVTALHTDESVFPATPAQLFQTSLLSGTLLCPKKIWQDSAAFEIFSIACSIISLCCDCKTNLDSTWIMLPDFLSFQ